MSRNVCVVSGVAHRVILVWPRMTPPDTLLAARLFVLVGLTENISEDNVHHKIIVEITFEKCVVGMFSCGMGSWYAAIGAACPVLRLFCSSVCCSICCSVCCSICCVCCSICCSVLQCVLQLDGQYWVSIAPSALSYHHSGAAVLVPVCVCVRVYGQHCVKMRA